jgi:hypothetical protein
MGVDYRRNLDEESDASKEPPDTEGEDLVSA